MVLSAGMRSLLESFLMCLTSLLRLLRKLLFTGLNVVVWIIFIMPSSKSLSSSIGGGFFVDLKPKFSLVDVD